MKNTETTTSDSAGNNAVLYAVTPKPKLSTDGTALDGVSGLRGSGIGATSKDRLLELFSGSKSVSTVAHHLGMRSLSVDKFIESDLQIGIEELSKETILEMIGEPTIIWASPVCSAWSKTGWFHYWDTDFYRQTKRFKPKKQGATDSIEMVRKTIEIFSWFPDATFFMENPEGMLYKHPVINTFLKYGLNVDRKRITYCRYGDLIRKPTHIWTNSTNWKPRPICQNGDHCHVSSPRCTQNGIYQKKDSFTRSMIPSELCFEILQSCINK